LQLFGNGKILKNDEQKSDSKLRLGTCDVEVQGRAALRRGRLVPNFCVEFVNCVIPKKS
jgi:hypothetical protein